MSIDKVHTLKTLREREWPVTSYHPISWDEIFFLTAYREKQTLLMLTKGEGLVVDRPLKYVMNKFAETAQIWELDTKCFYQQYKHRPIAYVAGFHALVPSCGAKDTDVVYYMAHFMKAHEYNGKTKEMLLYFCDEKRGTHFKLGLDVARGAFEGILDSVDKYERQQQLRFKQFEMWVGRNPQISWAEFKQLNADFLAAEDEWGLALLMDFCTRTYGESHLEECQAYIKKYFHRPYRI